MAITYLDEEPTAQGRRITYLDEEVPTVPPDILARAKGTLPVQFTRGAFEQLGALFPPLGRAAELLRPTGELQPGAGIAPAAGGIAASLPFLTAAGQLTGFGRALRPGVPLTRRIPTAAVETGALTGLTEILMGRPRQAIPAAVGGTLAGGTLTAGIGVPLAGIQALRQVKGLRQLLGGAPKAIEEAEQALDTVAHQTVQSIRRGGSFNQQVFQALGREAEIAWQPMKQIAGAIPDRIPVGELLERAAQRFSDPQRFNAASEAIREITGAKGRELFDLSAQELIDAATGLSRSLRSSVRKGIAKRDFAEQVVADVRSIIADVLQRRAPENLKTAVFDAWRQWGDYATDAERLFGLFQPGASQRAPTRAGVAFLKRAATGQLRPDELEFLGRITQVLGTDLAKSLQQPLERLRRITQLGRRGRLVGRAAETAAIFSPAAAILRLIFGGARTPTEQF